MSQHAEAIRTAHARGYRVTPAGEFISITGRTRKPYINPCKKYALHSIRIDGRATHIYAHKLAAYQWFGEAALAAGVHVRHLDGNPLNNSRANLALGSAKQNSLDRDQTARKAQSLKAAKARRALTDEQALELVSLSRQGWRGSALAARFGIRKSTVSEILSGKLYSETTGIEQQARGAA